jgi:hypothetical protein
VREHLADCAHADRMRARHPGTCASAATCQPWPKRASIVQNTALSAAKATMTPGVLARLPI